MTPGPAPKHHSERRRRNAPTAGEWVELSATVEKPILPPLPRRTKAEGPWSARTRKTWEAWRRDPATTQYTPADVAFAIDTAYLLELANARPTATLLAEIRLRMDGLGLTAKGKRYLRWHVGEPGEVVQLGVPRSPKRRRRLSAVPRQENRRP